MAVKGKKTYSINHCRVCVQFFAGGGSRLLTLARCVAVYLLGADKRPRLPIAF